MFPIGISVLFGCLFWVLDGVIQFYFFSDWVRLLIVEGPETLMESIISKVPTHSLIVRITFLAAAMTGGLLGAGYFLSLKRSRQELGEAEKALHESEEKYRDIVENVGDWVWEFDANGQYTYSSPVVKQVLGYEPAEVIGKSPADLMPAVEAKVAIKKYLKYRVAKMPFKAMVTALTHKDGHPVILETSGQPVLDERGALVSYRGVGRDITKRRQAEVALQGAHEELERRVRERTAQLDATNKELKDFAYIVSHDLKAPLRAISQLTGWIATDYADRLDPAGKEMMALILKRVQRMDGFIEGILSYSRIGGTGEKKRRLELNQIVREAIDNLARLNNVTVTIVDDLPVVNQDPIPMGQIFQNLIGNAIKYMDKPEGVVRVSCKSRGDYWEFSISDNGPGIDPKYHEKIFQIFQTLAPRDDIESTGIGLTLVKKAIEINGGSIRVESVVGAGSNFIFTLPRGGEKDEKFQTNPPD